MMADNAGRVEVRAIEPAGDPQDAVARALALARR